MPRNTQIDKKTHKEVTQWILLALGTSFTCILEKKRSIRRIEVAIVCGWINCSYWSHHLSRSIVTFSWHFIGTEFISLRILIIRSLYLSLNLSLFFFCLYHLHRKCCLCSRMWWSWTCVHQDSTSKNRYYTYWSLQNLNSRWQSIKIDDNRYQSIYWYW